MRKRRRACFAMLIRRLTDATEAGQTANMARLEAIKGRHAG